MGKASPLGPSQLALEKILKEPQARRWFEWLVGHNCDRDFITARLTRIPFASKTKVKLIEGLDPRAVQKLPSDLDAMAAKIEKVNASPFNPRTLLPNFRKSRSKVVGAWAARGELEPRATIFSNLPMRMREYADYLRHCLDLDAKANQQDLTLRHSERQLELLRLLTHIEERAGSPSFGRVEGLVNAAFNAAGVPVRKGNPDAQISLRRVKSLYTKHWFVRLVLRQSGLHLPEK